MSQKLIEFLVHFSDFSYNIIAYFYPEICTIYQIYILHKFKAEVKTDQGPSRSRQRLKVATRSDGKANKNYCDRRELAETKIGRTSRKTMSRHSFCGRDQKIMLNGLAMSLLGNSKLRQKYKLKASIKVATWNLCHENKNELYS